VIVRVLAWRGVVSVRDAIPEPRGPQRRGESVARLRTACQDPGPWQLVRLGKRNGPPTSGVRASRRPGLRRDDFVPALREFLNRPPVPAIATSAGRSSASASRLSEPLRSSKARRRAPGLTAGGMTGASYRSGTTIRFCEIAERIAERTPHTSQEYSLVSSEER
jgi:hypothetical protein